MKIAMIGQRGIPASYGGIDLHVEQLSLRLTNRGHEVTVFCRHRHYVSKEEEFMGVKLKYLPAINNRVLETLSHSLVCSIYASLKDYELVHFQGLGSAIFSILPRLFLKKAIVTIHSLDWQKQKWGWFIKRALKICEWAALRFPNKTIVVSKTLKQYYKDTYNRDLIYIPNGADNYEPGLHSYRLGSEHKRSGGASLFKGLSDFDLRENGYILFLGRLVPEKGCHYLIRAFKQIKTDKKLVVVGGSSYTDRYVQSVKEMAAGDNRIIFTGPLYGSKKKVLLKCAYIFVLPSEVEGLSISLFEAMSYGKCVLVSDTSENMEAVGNCGFSFRSEDELDLRERLNRLLSNKNLVENMGQRAQHWVKEYYNWQTIVDRIEELYSSAVGDQWRDVEKRLVKFLLLQLRLLKLAQQVYGYIKGARPFVVYREFMHRIKGTPDEIPLPPSRLISLVLTIRWVSIFLDSGEINTANMISTLKKNGFDIDSFNSIIDFGCGCGRMIRHLKFLEKPKLYATDYNRDLIHWCRRNLNFAQFDTNNLYPPLKYENAKFDFVYAHSVFIHLNEELQQKWMAELWRVLQAGGLLYFTTPGNQCILSRTDKQKRQFEAGQLVVVNPQSAGQNICAAFYPREFVKQRLLDGFALVDFVPGENKEYHRQDVYIVRKL